MHHDSALKEGRDRMQVVILCGGQGTRLREKAEHLPKPMVPIGGKPILWHIMKHCAAHGMREFVLCLGYKSFEIKRWFLEYHLRERDFTFRLNRPDQMEIHQPDREEDDWLVTFAETGEHAMTGARLARASKYLRGPNFLLTYGDGVSDVDLTDLTRFHKGHGKLATVTAVRTPGRYGELKIEGDSVQAFEEKPDVTQGRINGGFFMLRREVVDRLDDDPGLIWERGPLEGLAADGELAAYRHDGFWHAMDTPRDHSELEKMWFSGEAPWATWLEHPGENHKGSRRGNSFKSIRERA